MEGNPEETIPDEKPDLGNGLFPTAVLMLKDDRGRTQILKVSQVQVVQSGKKAQPRIVLYADL